MDIEDNILRWFVDSFKIALTARSPFENVGNSDYNYGITNGSTKHLLIVYWHMKQII